MHLGCSTERPIAALRKAGAEVGYQKYKYLGYRFGLSTGTGAAGWVADAIRSRERE